MNTAKITGKVVLKRPDFMARLDKSIEYFEVNFRDDKAFWNCAIAPYGGDLTANDLLQIKAYFDDYFNREERELNDKGL